MNAASRLSAVALALATSACSVRTDFIRATGAPLTLAADPERPGGVVVKQGEQVLDEESFYRIVEDPEASRRFTVHRLAGRRDATIGSSMTGLGLPSAVCGGVALAASDPSVLGIGIAVFAVGAVSVVVGVPLALHGQIRARDPDVRLLDDLPRMRRAVERYNASTRLRPGPAAPAPNPGGGTP